MDGVERCDKRATGRSLPAVSVAERVPPHVFFVVSALFHYLGPAFAVLLFGSIGVLGVMWLRVVSAGAVLAVWRRPWRSIAEGAAGARKSLLLLGIVLALMNSCFYLAIARVPLGTVAAIEFAGPVTLAALGARTTRNLLALALAVVGVSLLTEVRIEGEPLGFVFAFANMGLFAAYIVLGHVIARDGGAGGIDRLAGAMLVAALIASPIGMAEAARAFSEPRLLAAGIGVGICSSVIPYVCDQLAMARLPRATFALLLSLLPATAMVVGVFVLRQFPQPLEIAGVLLVVLAVGFHRSSD